MVIDGVYAADDDGRPRFHPLPAPEDHDVLCLTAIVNQRVRALLDRRGLGAEADPQQADPLSEDDPGLAALLASSVGRRIAVGSNAGDGVVHMGDQIEPDRIDTFQGTRCAMVSGFSVHANVSVEARDRMRLERLMRYAARPAVATDRLSVLSDGRLHYRLKRPWRDEPPLLFSSVRTSSRNWRSWCGSARALDEVSRSTGPGCSVEVPDRSNRQCPKRGDRSEAAAWRRTIRRADC
jgi:hypothetical protein